MDIFLSNAPYYALFIMAVGYACFLLYILFAIISIILTPFKEYFIARWKKICFSHNWSNWEQYEVETPKHRLTKNWSLCATREIRQLRRCKNCNKVEDILITQFEVD